MEGTSARPAQPIQSNTSRGTFNPKVFKPVYQQAQSAKPAVSTKKETGGDASDWKAGDKVSHKKWGTGTVVRVSGKAKDMELDVAFAQQGVKRLLAAFAPIEKI